MKDSIIKKIGEQLDKGIRTEADYVFFLTQIRRYLEHEQVKDFWNLRMCANWALHTTLDNEKNNTVKIFLEEVNDFLIDADQNGGYNLDQHQSLRDKILFFTSFELELNAFLNHAGIKTSYFDDPSNVKQFLDLYGKVIEDTPLVCKASKPLSHFSHLSLSKRKSIMGINWPAPLFWSIKRNNGKTVDIRI